MNDQTPFERAGNALLRNRAYQAGVAFGVPDETEAEAKHRSEIIKAVLESIDVDGIAQAIHDGPEAQRQYDKAGIAPHSWADCTVREQYLNDARAVKDYLTGGTS